VQAKLRGIRTEFRVSLVSVVSLVYRRRLTGVVAKRMSGWTTVAHFQTIGCR